MTEENYRIELLKVLNQEKNSIISRINSFLQKIPQEAVRVNIIIFPGQDGEGEFTIHGGLNGPNLYTLNKKVEDWTQIFDVKCGPNGYEPKIPIVDPHSIDYYVNDIIKEICTKWINDNWNLLDTSKVKVAISIYSDHI